MTKLRAALSTLIVIIGVTHSLSDSIEDPEYRPWDQNDTSAAGISLSGTGLQSMDAMYRISIPNLKWLVLNENEIESIPSDALKSFSELTYLSLAKNGIDDVAIDAFENLTKLEILNVDGNPYFGIPSKANGLEVLNSLKRLYMRDCQIMFFTAPTLISHLTHLHLSENQLRTFYTNENSSLTNLYLNRNKLKYVSLSKFGTLTYVDVAHNELPSIVREFELLPVDYVETGYDRPRDYNFDYPHTSNPQDEGGFYLDDAAATLEYLIVSFNQLSRIEPSTFRDSKALIHVDLSSNLLTKLSSETFNDLPQLEVILLDQNQIKQISHRAFKNLPNLKTISLKYNEIDEIDEDTFSGLNSSANNISLFLDHNRIDTLSQRAFQNATGLKHISLSNNRIKTISSQVFVNLPNLESIVIENQVFGDHPFRHNPPAFEPLTRKAFIKSDAFYNLPNLTSIFISGNFFTEIEPRAFHDLPKLQLLDLSKNKIANISSEAFSNLPELETLNLRENLIITIAPNTFPQSLKHLDLASNSLCPRSDCWHVEKLVHLEKLDLSKMFEQFLVDELADLPQNLTILMSRRVDYPFSPPPPCY